MIQLIRILAPLVFLFFMGFSLCGCQHSYPAPLYSVNPSEEIAISSNTYIVMYKDNTLTDHKLAFKNALKRCAEITREKGFSYFKVLHSSVSLKEGLYLTSLHQQIYLDHPVPSSHSANERNLSDLLSPPDSLKHAEVTIRMQMYQHSVAGAYDANAVLSSFIFYNPFEL